MSVDYEIYLLTKELINISGFEDYYYIDVPFPCRQEILIDTVEIRYSVVRIDIMKSEFFVKKGKSHCRVEEKKEIKYKLQFLIRKWKIESIKKYG